MFDIGRDLMRFFAPAKPRDGLSLGDCSLLEMLDLSLLKAEAKAADVAAGRVGAKDRPQRMIEAAAVRRELARRTGDPAALRKAASSAEAAAKAMREEHRAAGTVRAQCEQATIALLGADLFGEEGLDGAAEFLLERVGDGAAPSGLRARIHGRRAMAGGADLHGARAAAALFDRPLHALHGKNRLHLYAAAQLRCERAEMLTSCGAQLGEIVLIEQALADLDKALSTLDPAYAPLTVARALELRGLAQTRLAELDGDAAPILEGLEDLAEALELVTPDHSPLDWARICHSQALALMALGEAGDSEAAFDRALRALGKALKVLEDAPHLALRAAAAQDRAACLVRRAEMRGDHFALDEAEAILRGELAVLKGAADPAAWAVVQLNLARIYMIRAENGAERAAGDLHARAGEALATALDIFGDAGLRGLAAEASAGLERLREQVN